LNSAKLGRFLYVLEGERDPYFLEFSHRGGGGENLKKAAFDYVVS
jgi:hypothetical protein